jgi:hypothetical protein
VEDILAQGNPWKVKLAFALIVGGVYTHLEASLVHFL